jgi:hypothetical protein
MRIDGFDASDVADQFLSNEIVTPQLVLFPIGWKM